MEEPVVEDPDLEEPDVEGGMVVILLNEMLCMKKKVDEDF